MTGGRLLSPTVSDRETWTLRELRVAIPRLKAAGLLTADFFVDEGVEGSAQLREIDHVRSAVAHGQIVSPGAPDKYGALSDWAETVGLALRLYDLMAIGK